MGYPRQIVPYVPGASGSPVGSADGVAAVIVLDSDFAKTTSQLKCQRDSSAATARSSAASSGWS
jgi:hypothetical protein